MKKQLKDFLFQMGVDDVGFCSIENYNSPRSPKIQDLFPDVKTIIVIANKDLYHSESPNSQIRSIGKNDSASFAQSCRIRLARYLEKNCKAKAMSIPNNYPMDLSAPNFGFVGTVSMRHAAVGAGLGLFGRHNLVIHPQFGTQVSYTGVLTNLDIEPDTPLDPSESLCNDCDICVESCPVGALDKENFTDAPKCIRHSQPYGISNIIGFGKKFLDTATDEQKKLLTSTEFMNLIHVLSFGSHYECYTCYNSCPVGKE